MSSLVLLHWLCVLSMLARHGVVSQITLSGDFEKTDVMRLASDWVPSAGQMVSISAGFDPSSLALIFSTSPYDISLDVPGAASPSGLTRGVTVAVAVENAVLGGMDVVRDADIGAGSPHWTSATADSIHEPTGFVVMWDVALGTYGGLGVLLNANVNVLSGKVSLSDSAQGVRESLQARPNWMQAQFPFDCTNCKFFAGGAIGQYVVAVGIAEPDQYVMTAWRMVSETDNLDIIEQVASATHGSGACSECSLLWSFDIAEDQSSAVVMHQSRLCVFFPIDEDIICNILTEPTFPFHDTKSRVVALPNLMALVQVENELNLYRLFRGPDDYYGSVNNEFVAMYDIAANECADDACAGSIVVDIAVTANAADASGSVQVTVIEGAHASDPTPATVLVYDVTREGVFTLNRRWDIDDETGMAYTIARGASVSAPTTAIIYHSTSSGKSEWVAEVYGHPVTDITVYVVALVLCLATASYSGYLARRAVRYARTKKAFTAQVGHWIILHDQLTQGPIVEILERTKDSMTAIMLVSPPSGLHFRAVDYQLLKQGVTVLPGQELLRRELRVVADQDIRTLVR